MPKHHKQSPGRRWGAMGAPSSRRTQGTATGEQLCANAEDETLCCCQYGTHHFAKTFTFKQQGGIMKTDKNMKEVLI